jgi:hypothetical protein
MPALFFLFYLESSLRVLKMLFQKLLPGKSLALVFDIDIMNHFH